VFAEVVPELDQQIEKADPLLGFIFLKSQEDPSTLWAVVFGGDDQTNITSTTDKNVHHIRFNA
jgi:hypothetical protein